MVAALFGEIAGVVQWGWLATLYRGEQKVLSFLFRLRYLMQDHMSGTPTFKSKPESSNLDP